MKRVVVGLSGGVDSSVAAYLLKKQGYEVIGMFMKNWHDDSVTISKECPWLEDSNDALLVAQALGIPFQTIDLSETYKERIVDYMFAEYQAGRTPNPDVLCNREIKFDVFLQAALRLGADFVATGHYVRKESFLNEKGEEIHRLLAGKDHNKDQSYFLCQVNQDQLAKALFPIGELRKPEVREIAESIGLITAKKKDSQGLCFVGKVRLPEFLQQKLLPEEGNIIEIQPEAPMYKAPVLAGERQQTSSGMLHSLSAPYIYQPIDGEAVGKHQGAHYFTIGQRKGLNVGGKAEPLFVIGTDTTTNTVYVGMGDQHPGLYRKALFVPHSDVHWVREDRKMEVGQSENFQVRIRYRQPLQAATLFREESGMYIVFQEAQRGITPGQFAAWYEEDELIGSGVIQ